MVYSVIIRTKNSGRTLEECLKSVLAQSVTPSEIIVVDSGSTDATLEIAKKYSAKIVFYPSNLEFNYSKALNIGIQNSSSPFILLLSSHVEFVNFNNVEWMSRILVADSICKAVSTRNIFYKRENEIIEFDQVESRKIFLKNFQGAAMYNFCSLFRKEDWESHNFNENYLRCEDQEWAFHFMELGFYVVAIDRPLIYYNNPYRNFKKDLWDQITLGETIYPYFISNNYVFDCFKKGVRKPLSGDFTRSIYYFKLAFNILYHKNIKKITIKSISNNDLDN